MIVQTFDTGCRQPGTSAVAYTRPALSNWRPTGRIRPARRFYLARDVSLILFKIQDTCPCNAGRQQSTEITK